MSTAEKLKPEEAFEEEDEVIEIIDFDEGAKGHEDSEGIWLLSYADMMTLLMGFFALLTSMASFETEKFAQVGSQTAEYFGGVVDKTMEQLGDEISEVIKAKGLDAQVKVERTSSQVSITFEGTLFFELGSVALKETAQDLMSEIINILGEKAPNHKFLIEGHTDDLPMSKGLIASNWELSSLRSAAVARLFEKKGFARKQIMTIGWGETRPLVSNRDNTGQAIKENQAKNRRVVLKILNHHPL
ncbi:MAG: flagellar motor protein MotB [Bdellovibrionales bacterium]|nr:flagellar motor protein MotB [Bdellovibrionales bacterium]